MEMFKYNISIIVFSGIVYIFCFMTGIANAVLPSDFYSGGGIPPADQPSNFNPPLSGNNLSSEENIESLSNFYNGEELPPQEEIQNYINIVNDTEINISNRIDAVEQLEIIGKTLIYRGFGNSDAVDYDAFKMVDEIKENLNDLAIMNFYRLGIEEYAISAFDSIVQAEKKHFISYVNDILGIELREEQYSGLSLAIGEDDNGAQIIKDGVDFRRDVYSEEFAELVFFIKSNYEMAWLGEDKLLKIGKIFYNHDKFESLLRDPYFIEFDEVLAENYKISALNNLSQAAYIYYNSEELSTIVSEENIKIINKVYEYFGPNTADISINEISVFMEELEKIDNIDLKLSDAKKLYGDLNMQFSELEAEISGYGILQLISLSQEAGKVDVLLSDKAREVYNVLIENFNFGLGYLGFREDSSLKELSDFIENYEFSPEDLKVLRDFGVTDIKFLGSYSDDINYFIEKLKNEEVNILFERIRDENPDFSLDNKYGVNNFLSLYETLDNSDINIDQLIDLWNETEFDINNKYLPLWGYIIGQDGAFEILNVVVTNYPGLYPNLKGFKTPGLENILSLPQTKEIYNLLINKYEISRTFLFPINLSSFLELVSNKNILDILEDEEFYSIYNFVTEKLNESKKLFILSDLIDHYSENEDLYEVLLSEDSLAIAQRISNLDIKVRVSVLDKYIDIVKNEGDDFFELLFNDYRYSLNDSYISIEYIRDFLLHEDGLFEKLKSEECKEFYQDITKINPDFVPEMRVLDEFVKLSQIDNSLEIIKNLDAIEFTLNNSNIKDILRILGDRQLYEYLKKDKVKEFADFYDRVTKRYINYNIRGEDVEHILRLYQRIDISLNKDRLMETLFSDDFVRTYDIIKRDFHFTSIESSVLWNILSLAYEMDFAEIESLRPYFGKKEIYANDLMLLNAISNSPELVAFLEDRDSLEKEVSGIYDREPVFRTKWGSREPPIVPYTERPDLSELDSLALIRLYLLNEALKDETFLERIGEIVSSDIQDTTTEYGGYISSKNGELNIFNVTSLSEMNGAYWNTLNGFFTGGIMTFHQHALSYNNSEYSGPSGRVGGWSGDLAVAGNTNSTGVVITTLGKEGSDSIKINIDMYYADKTGDEPKAIIVDLGEFIVP